MVLPHFDRWLRRLADNALEQLAASLPPGVALVGVDEDTALVDFDGCSASEKPSVWRVLGRQGVAVIDAERGQIRYPAGATLELTPAGFQQAGKR
jgi:cyanophycinase-like exopeptidase